MFANYSLCRFPVVSVIAICYNHSNYVLECLDSIRAQTYPNIEIIIMDDFSKDDSVLKINNWINKYSVPCTFIVHNVNVGICKTLNEAISHARGDYISMISTDDVWLSDKIKKQVEVMDNSGPEVGVVYSDAHQIDAHGNLLNKKFIESHRFFDKPPEGYIHSILLEDNFIPAMTTLIKKSCYDKVGYYDEELMFEDWDMWLRISKYFKFVFFKDITAKYRILNTSLVRNMGLRGIESVFLIFIKELKVCKDPDDISILKRRMDIISKRLYENGHKKSSYYLYVNLKYNISFVSLVLFACSASKIKYVHVQGFRQFIRNFLQV